MRKEILEAINENAKRLDEMYFELGDVLDVKASIILVLVTVLGAVSGQVFAAWDLTIPIQVLQTLTVVSLGVAAILTLCALWIRKFDAPPAPEDWRDILGEWEKYYAEYEDRNELLLHHFEDVRGDLTAQRIKGNRIICARKSTLNKRALLATAVALALELTTFALLALRAYRS